MGLIVASKVSNKSGDKVRRSNMNMTALSEYLVSVHQKLNPTRSKFLRTSTEVLPVATDEVYQYGTAKTAANTISHYYTIRNSDLFESSGPGLWRLTEKGHSLEVDHEVATSKLLAKIKKDKLRKIDKLLLEANDELSKKKEGSRRTATRTHIVRSGAVRELALIFHGNKCAVCDRSPKDFGSEYNDSMMEVHHINELHTYEDKGITETDIRTDTTVLCVCCHRCNVHLSGSMSAQSIDDAKAFRAKAMK